MTVRRLPDALVNRIAAGEVVERPASVVKELVENSIDAGASSIQVLIRDGGRALISVSDDGCGMARDDLWLAVDRHATSKLPDGALDDIRSFGFRGEALPSIAAVSRLTIATRWSGDDAGWSLEVTAGCKAEPAPVAHGAGTRVEARDLFFATPARLKFLKAQTTEVGHVVEAVQRLAMAHPRIGFVVTDGARRLLSLPVDGGDLAAARASRLERIFGAEFTRSAVALTGEREGARVSGFAGLPTLNRRLASMQFLFVNGRPVRDRLLYGAIRAAYQGLLPSDRHPVAALFLDVPTAEVDVNVHPMKTEVRFRDAGRVRGLIVSALRHALAEAGHRTAVAPAFGAAPAGGAARGGGGWAGSSPARAPAEVRQPPGLSDGDPAFDFGRPVFARQRAQAPPGEDDPSEANGPALWPLGVARAQVHATYIIAETADGVVIVDQHAAHERLTQERLKRALAESSLPRQGLLIPEIVPLDPPRAAALVARSAELETLGLVVEAFGHDAVVVREIPALLNGTEVGGLVRDLADEMAGENAALPLQERLDKAVATVACHHSVRAGRTLNAEEMNALLREMEATAYSGQCSHGRPTYVELKLADIERLFGRR
jgi:DNA mismatch repair protein MutL